MCHSLSLGISKIASNRKNQCYCWMAPIRELLDLTIYQLAGFLALGSLVWGWVIMIAVHIPFLSFSRSASMYGKQNWGDSYPESVDSVGVTEQPIVFFQVVALGSLVSFGHFPQFYRFVCNEIKSFFSVWGSFLRLNLKFYFTTLSYLIAPSGMKSNNNG